ncbi:Ohr family peroxiredoxin [Aquabacterium sp.]|uniref:Ohr family peroxiredoxin n=1 Tax=Aquabacterium sp. TaxID=1872578 RepID=UPI002B7769A2|nr:Ohr family peroxiredoxin [Aquabacterium sp.]HSW04108.1 Ohr family peroxiredoxin [Aquabacterium sp.]
MKKLSPPPVSLLDRYRGSTFEPVYASKVTVTGGEARHGRASGHVRSDDGELDIALRLPVLMGGEGGGTNPEQLFAAAYGACFHGALSLLATKHGIAIPNHFSVEVEVAFGRDPVDGQHTLTAHVIVRLPGLALTVAEELVRATERICPYAKLVRQGIEGSVRVLV